jgi:hypothetical protein
VRGAHDPLGALLDAAVIGLGHDGSMPARLDVPLMPERAAAAHQAIAAVARLTTLRFLLSHPGSTRPDIVHGTGISASSVIAALNALAELDYVSFDPAGQRRGHTVRYTVDRERITGDLSSLVTWLTR